MNYPVLEPGTGRLDPIDDTDSARYTWRYDIARITHRQCRVSYLGCPRKTYGSAKVHLIKSFDGARTDGNDLYFHDQLVCVASGNTNCPRAAPIDQPFLLVAASSNTRSEHSRVRQIEAVATEQILLITDFLQ